MSKVNLKFLLEYNVLFGETTNSAEDYLTGIPNEVLLKAATYFLGFSNHNSKYDRVDNFVSEYFSTGNQDFLNGIYGHMKELEAKYNGNFSIVSFQSALQLFEFSLQNTQNEPFKTKTEIERDLFKALLTLNQHNNDQQSKAKSSTDGLPSEISFSAFCLSQSFPISELINYEIIELATGQIVKSAMLFEYLERTEQTHPHLVKFLEFYECSNWKEYLRRLLPLIIQVIKKSNEKATEIVVLKNDEYESTCKFIEKLSIADREELDEYDYVSLRAKPFVKMSEGIYRVIFDLFSLEAVHKGLFFKLSEINSGMVAGNKIKSFRGHYCDGFSEQYLLYSVMERIYNGRYLTLSGAEVKERGVVAEPDFYIRNGKRVFVFESKDILINKEIKGSCDFKKYEIEFKKKLYFDDSDGTVSNKAVLQIINNIERILTNSFQADKGCNPNNAMIYPVLILHDHMFNVAGLNSIVNFWFNVELEKIAQKGINVSRVRPICIINMDTLIFYSDLFADKVLMLEDVIDKYFEYVNPLSYKGKLNDEILTRSVLPFSIFLMNYTIDRKIRRPPSILEDKGFALFE